MTAPHEGHGRLTEAPRPDPLAWLRLPDWDQERLDALCAEYSPCDRGVWDDEPGDAGIDLDADGWRESP